MFFFKFKIPSQIIFKIRSLFTNTRVSLWSDSVSIEEGWGSQGNHTGEGKNFGVGHMSHKVCKPNLVNRLSKSKFNNK